MILEPRHDGHSPSFIVFESETIQYVTVATAGSGEKVGELILLCEAKVLGCCKHLLLCDLRL